MSYVDSLRKLADQYQRGYELAKQHNKAWDARVMSKLYYLTLDKIAAEEAAQTPTLETR